MNGRYSLKKIRRVIRMYRAGLVPVGQILKKERISRHWLFAVLSDNGVPRRRRPARPAARKAAVIRRKVAERRARGEGLDEIARDLGLTRRRLDGILNPKRGKAQR